MKLRTKFLSGLWSFALVLFLAPWLTGAAGQGQPAPAITGVKLGASETIDLQAKSYQKPVVLVFWASWCGPCRHEAPELVDLFKAKEGKIEIIGVSVDRSMKKSQEFADEFKLPYTNLHDPDAKTARTFGVYSLPSIVLIDPDGVIRFKGHRMNSDFQKLLGDMIKA